MKKLVKSKSQQRFLAVYLLCVVGSMLMASCTHGLDRSVVKKYSRVGESINVSYPKEIIEDAIITWSKSLTNGYTIYKDKEARRRNIVLTNDLATLFLLEKDQNFFTDRWGSSACLSPPDKFYSAQVIIRLLPVSGKNQISVAIHGERLKSGLQWNIHTFGFSSTKPVAMPPCKEDERQVLEAIMATLRITTKQ